GADDLAAEAKAAVDRADMGQLQQHPIAIAVHNAFDGRELLLAQRVGTLSGQLVEFAEVGHKLARDRILGLAAPNEGSELAGYGDRIALSHARKPRHIGRSNEPGVAQLYERPQCACVSWHEAGILRFVGNHNVRRGSGLYTPSP